MQPTIFIVTLKEGSCYDFMAAFATEAKANNYIKSYIEENRNLGDGLVIFEETLR